MMRGAAFSAAMRAIHFKVTIKNGLEFMVTAGHKTTLVGFRLVLSEHA